MRCSSRVGRQLRSRSRSAQLLIEPTDSIEALFKAALARDANLACEILAQHIRFTFQSIRLLPSEALNH